MARSHTVECVLHITESCPTTLCSLFIEHVSIEHHTHCWVCHRHHWVMPNPLYTLLREHVSIEYHTHCWVCYTHHWVMSNPLHTLLSECGCWVLHTLLSVSHIPLSYVQPHCTHCWASMSVLRITHTVLHTPLNYVQPHCTHCWVHMSATLYTLLGECVSGKYHCWVCHTPLF